MEGPLGPLGRKSAEIIPEEPANQNIWQRAHLQRFTVRHGFLGFPDMCLCALMSSFFLDYHAHLVFSEKHEHAHRLLKAGRRPRSSNASRGSAQPAQPTRHPRESFRGVTWSRGKQGRARAKPGPLSTKKAWVGGSLKLQSVHVVGVAVLVQNQHILFVPSVPPPSHRMCKIMYEFSNHLY